MFKKYQWNQPQPKKVVQAPIVIGKDGKIVPTAKVKAPAKGKVVAKGKAKKVEHDNFNLTRDDFMGIEEDMFSGIDEELGEMEGALDFLKDINDKYLKKPVQKAIDVNRDKLIQKTTSQIINAGSKVLDKVGGTDPKALAKVQALTSAITTGAVEGAQQSIMEKVKPYIPWVIGGSIALGAGLVYMKKSKKVA